LHNFDALGDAVRQPLKPLGQHLMNSSGQLQHSIEGLFMAGSAPSIMPENSRTVWPVRQLDASQISVCSEISSASMPRYRTALSSLEWPS